MYPVFKFVSILCSLWHYVYLKILFIFKLIVKFIVNKFIYHLRKIVCMQEGDMPLDELLALYGYTDMSEESESNYSDHGELKSNCEGLNDSVHSKLSMVKEICVAEEGRDYKNEFEDDKNVVDCGRNNVQPSMLRQLYEDIPSRKISRPSASFCPLRCESTYLFSYLLFIGRYSIHLSNAFILFFVLFKQFFYFTGTIKFIIFMELYLLFYKVFMLVFSVFYHSLFQ